MKLFGLRTASKPNALPGQGDGSAGELEPPKAGMAEMGFLDHLEEFRWTLIKGFSGLIIATIGCSFFSRWIIDELLLGPKKPTFFMYRFFGIDATTFDLQNRTITGQFFAHIGTILVVGIIIGSPLFVYQLWKFIEPGLYPSEKKGLRFASVFATVFFTLGILFGYLIITPLALQFFANYTISPDILNEFDISRYFSMVTFWAFGAGVLFELPVVVYFLAKLGIATPVGLRNARKYAVPIVLTLAAFLTPPDPISQILVAIPLMALYEGSIFIAAFVERKRERELKAALE